VGAAELSTKRAINILYSCGILDGFKLFVWLEGFWVRYVSYFYTREEMFFSREVLEGASCEVLLILFTLCQLPAQLFSKEE